MLYQKGIVMWKHKLLANWHKNWPLNVLSQFFNTVVLWIVLVNLHWSLNNVNFILGVTGLPQLTINLVATGSMQWWQNMFLNQMKNVIILHRTKPVIRNCLQVFETVRTYKVEDMYVSLQVYVHFSYTVFHIFCCFSPFHSR